MKLAIIGASYLQLPLVEKAHELGHETYCFAWRDGAVCADLCTAFYELSITDHAAIIEQCRAIGIDGVCSVASDLAVATVNAVAEALRLTANPCSSTSVCTDKGEMRRQLEEAGLPVPDWKVCAPGDACPLAFPVVVKPTDRSGSLGVKLCGDDDAFESAVCAAAGFAFSGAAIVESFVSGREISVETLTYRGRHDVLALTDKITTGPPEFVEMGHRQPSVLTEDAMLRGRVEEVVRASLNALGVQNGAGHVELMVGPDAEVTVIEVGARMGGDFIGSHLVPLTTGYDYQAAVIALALGQEPAAINELAKPGVAEVHFFDATNYPSDEEWLELNRQASYVWGARNAVSEQSMTSSSTRSGYWITHTPNPAH